MSGDPLDMKGKLLVAAPGLVDPNFARTVVYLVEHRADDGALGVVLNRPSTTEIDQALPGWASAAAHPSVVFVGGPVSPDAAICLARVATPDPLPADVWQPVRPPLGVLDLSADVDQVLPALDRLRVFAGYAGWAPGQLEGEIAQGGWFVVDADPEDALVASPDALWSFVLRRQGGELAMVATYPADPSLN